MLIHILYIGIICFLGLALCLVWSVHVSQSNKLIKVNCLVAEMFLDEFRYNGIKFNFEALIYDKRHPMNNGNEAKSCYSKNRKYWALTAYQIEKATEQMLLFEAGEQYETLARFLHSKIKSNGDDN